MEKTDFPPGWSKVRARRLLRHYVSLPEEAVAEDEDAFEESTQTEMGVAMELAPRVRALIAERAR